MVLQLIDDMNKALDHDCYYAALALALALPDICGKAKNPGENNSKQRYINWYDEYVGAYEKCPRDDKMPYLSGEVVYQLRCSLFHEGTSNIDTGKVSEDICKVDKFVLLKQRKNEYHLYPDCASVSSCSKNSEPPYATTRSYSVNIRRLCYIISATAKGYYKEHPEQFDFSHCCVIDMG